MRDFRCDHFVRSTPALEIVTDLPLDIPHRTRSCGTNAANRKYPAMQLNRMFTPIVINENAQPLAAIGFRL